MSLEAEIKKLTDAITRLHQAIDITGAVTELTKEKAVGLAPTSAPEPTQEETTADECRELCRKIVSGNKEKKAIIKDIIGSFDGAKLVDDVKDLAGLKKALMEIL